jgi:hypothetical protein
MSNDFQIERVGFSPREWEKNLMENQEELGRWGEARR